MNEIEITRESKWRTQTGEIIRICDMADSHLLNAIRCLRLISPKGTKVSMSSSQQRRRYLNAMANEAYARGLELDPLTENEPVHE